MEKPLKIIGKVWKSVENVCERYEKKEKYGNGMERRKSIDKTWESAIWKTEEDM